MSGAIDLTFSDIAGASPHIKSGKLRPLAVTSTRRSSIFPQLPTMAEAGVPGFIASSWFAVFTTAGTPAPIIETLNHAIVRVLESAEINERMTGLGFEVAGSTPDQLRAFLESEIRKWSKVVKESGARVQ
jgi:tripartite-type tricarboxylate transporter receptor subunit TctC